VSYRFEWIAAPVVLVPVFLLLIGPVAVIVLLVVATAALAAVVALAGAVLALPYLLVRSLRRHLAERHHSTKEGTGLFGTAIAQTGRATQPSGVAGSVMTTAIELHECCRRLVDIDQAVELVRDRLPRADVAHRPVERVVGDLFPAGRSGGEVRPADELLVVHDRL
jgi:hypothetical protein